MMYDHGQFAVHDCMHVRPTPSCSAKKKTYTPNGPQTVYDQLFQYLKSESIYPFISLLSFNGYLALVLEIGSVIVIEMTRD